MRLTNKIALITGAARGTGEQTARLFVAEGARVVIGDVLEAEGRAVAQSLGAAAQFVKLDVTSEASWASAVEETRARFGGLNVLVNNAGLLHRAALEETSVDAFERLFRVNQLGPFLGIKAVTPALKAAGGGSIVNISSIDGLMAHNNLVAYVATK